MILGMSGQMESGKSTAAEFLTKFCGYEEVAFAKNLKEMCKYVFGLTDDQVYTTEGKARPFDKPIILTQDRCDQILDWGEDANNLTISSEDEKKIKKFIGLRMATPREVLQKVGTEICREIFGSQYHTNTAFTLIEKKGWDKVVISDARFANERKMITQAGGKNILIVCKGQEETYSGHASENDLGDPKDYDYVLFNDKDEGLQRFGNKVLNLHSIITIYKRGEDVDNLER